MFGQENLIVGGLHEGISGFKCSQAVIVNQSKRQGVSVNEQSDTSETKASTQSGSSSPHSRFQFATPSNTHISIDVKDRQDRTTVRTRSDLVDQCLAVGKVITINMLLFISPVSV